MIIRGTIVHGKHLGHRLGFPTVNLQSGSGLPRDTRWGVYAAWIRIDGDPVRYGCMVNIGRHPTAPEGPPTVEAHIFDFDRDVYDRQATLETEAFLRPETRFDSLQALIEQLKRDQGEARTLLGMD